MVGWLVGWSVTLELKSGKTRISAPAHPSATGGRVSGLVVRHEGTWRVKEGKTVKSRHPGRKRRERRERRRRKERRKRKRKGGRETCMINASLNETYL